MANGMRGGGGRKDGRLEIHLRVLQDIGPLGPLPKNLYRVRSKMFEHLFLKIMLNLIHCIAV